VYYYIIIIQLFDMISNFFIIKKVEHEELKTLKQIAMYYIKGAFLTDLISIMPYGEFNKNLLPLRFLKLLNFKQNENKFEQFFTEYTYHILHYTQIKKVLNFTFIFSLMTVIAQIFACCWVIIGIRE